VNSTRSSCAWLPPMRSSSPAIGSSALIARARLRKQRVPRAGAAFSAMHVALAQAVAGNDAALEVRERQMEELERQGRYPSGPCVPAVSIFGRAASRCPRLVGLSATRLNTCEYVWRSCCRLKQSDGAGAISAQKTLPLANSRGVDA
jgi:hypothetical protein